MILAALAVELLPDIANEHATPEVIIGSFALGSLFMYGLKLWTIRLEHRNAAAAASSASGVGLLVAAFIDIAVDGFIIGAGFAANGEAGTILALGLSVELLFLGMALASEAVKGRRVVALSTALGLTVLLFAVLGSVLLAGASQQLIGGVLAFSAAALLYLVTEELLMRGAYRRRKTHFHLGTFFRISGVLEHPVVGQIGPPIRTGTGQHALGHPLPTKFSGLRLVPI